MEALKIIALIFVALFIAGFLTVIIVSIEELFKNGGDFTMKNQPKPPVKKPNVTTVTDYYYQFTWLNEIISYLEKEIEGLKKANINISKKYKSSIIQNKIYKKEIERLKKELEGVI